MLEIANDVAGPGSTSRPVQTWPGKEGHGTVRAYRSGDSYWLEWPGVARFTFTPGQATIFYDTATGEEVVGGGWIAKS